MQCIFRANKIADARLTNVDTGDSIDVSCVYSHVGLLVEYMFNSVCV